jgi:hypothetical protein
VPLGLAPIRPVGRVGRAPPLRGELGNVGLPDLLVVAARPPRLQFGRQRIAHVRPVVSRQGIAQNKPMSALRIGSGKQRGVDPTFLGSEDDGTFRPSGIQHTQQIVGHRLQGCDIKRREPIRAPPPAPIRDDQSRVTGQAVKKPTECRPFPIEIDMRGVPLQIQQVEMTLPDNLVGERNIAIPRIVRLTVRLHAGRS